MWNLDAISNILLEETTVDIPSQLHSVYIYCMKDKIWSINNKKDLVAATEGYQPFFDDELL